MDFSLLLLKGKGLTHKNFVLALKKKIDISHMTSNGWEQENDVDGLEQYYSSTPWDVRVQKESLPRFIVSSETSKDVEPWNISLPTLELLVVLSRKTS